jgi:cytochrome c oxidase assembly protein subunit 15
MTRGAETRAAADTMTAATTADDRAIANWLLAVAGMIFVMVVLGGVTRLTESGLSIVDWKPLLGWLPPLSHAEWQAAFDHYKAFPEYVKKNPNMDLAGFQAIFWLEYLHRLWGRVIGVAFLLPFLWFWWRGRIRRGLWPKLIALFVLGGLQGVLGWFMVKSGMVDRPSVSQYRLAAHLSLAVAIYMAMLWIGWGLRARAGEPPAVPRFLKRFAVVVVVLTCVTMVAGAFVAGLDAGLIYNTFPQMGDGLVPPDLWRPDLGVLNHFENRVMVQFQHRVLGITTLLAAFLFWSLSRAARLAPGLRLACSTLMLMAGVQVLLGVTTLLLYVPVWAGALHQAGALLLITAGLRVVRLFAPPRTAAVQEPAAHAAVTA